MGERTTDKNEHEYSVFLGCLLSLHCEWVCLIYKNLVNRELTSFLCIVFESLMVHFLFL